MKWFSLLLVATSATAADLSARLADRGAVERVYYRHRTGDKPPFEKILTREQLRRIVERDLAKETVLKKRYGVAINDAQVGAEVARIDSLSRAPEMLAELKAALGNDTNRFARAVARPLVVERLLRIRFQEDAAIHSAQRQAAATLRASLLAARRGSNGVLAQVQLLRASHAGDVTETAWCLDQRAAGAGSLAGAEARPGQPPTQSFGELSKDLQTVLQAQLSGAGDVTAVIETPDGFLLFVAKAKSSAQLAVASINIPKRDYDRWVAEQAADGP